MCATIVSHILKVGKCSNLSGHDLNSMVDIQETCNAVLVGDSLRGPL
jgi:hypothetical protein